MVSTRTFGQSGSFGQKNVPKEDFYAHVKRPQRGPGLFKIAAAVGVSAGVLWAWQAANQPDEYQVSNIPQAADYLLKDPAPQFEPARKLRRPGGDLPGLKLTLFQYQTCPFCCKARSTLDYYGLSYDVIEVNSVTRKQVKWSKYKKVPFLLAETSDGRTFQLTDSTLIISAIASLVEQGVNKDLKSVLNSYPKMESRDVNDKSKIKTEIMNKYFVMFGEEGKTSRSKQSIIDERKWRKWADESLVHMLSPNVYRTPSEALQAFQWFDKAADWEKHFAAWERYLVIYVGALAMWLIGKRLKKRHLLKDDVRLSLYDDCQLWVTTLKKQKTPFLGGSSPNLGDLAVFGCLSAIEGCDAFQDLLQNVNIGPWFEAMKEAVKSGQGQALLRQ